MTLGAVSWSAPPEVCPPEAALQQRLGEVRARVDARVREHPAGFELSVSIDDQERTLVLPTCAEALESTVFLVELSAQAPARRRPLEISPAAQEERRGELAREQPAPQVRRLHLAVTAGAEWALLPSAVARLGLSLQLDLAWVRLVLDVRGSPPLRFTALGEAGVSLLPLFDAQLGACRLFELGPFAAGPCVQGSLGLVSATGFNVAVPRTQVVSVWTVGGGLRAALALTEAVELQAFASARVGPEVRYFFGDDGATAVRSGAVGIDTGLGVGARW